MKLSHALYIKISSSCMLHLQVNVDIKYSQMSLVVRKPVFGVSNQGRHKLGCTTTEDGWRIEILDLGSRGIVQPCSENKGVISFAVKKSAQLKNFYFTN